MKKKIFINGRFLTQKTTGVQRFAIEIVKEFIKINPSAIVVCPKNIINKQAANEWGVKVIGRLTGHLWEQIELPLYIRNNNGILLNLCNTGPILTKTNIITIHDLAVWDFPKSYSWKFKIAYRLMQPLLIRRALHIFTVSQFSKNRIQDLFKVSENKITVVKNSVAGIFKKNKTSVHGSGKTYLLAVSSLDPKKNFENLLKAFKKIQLNQVDLVLVGSKSTIFQNTKLQDKLNENNIKFSGYIEDSQLAELYSLAKLFIYPSFYEGFGIPPLEAMASGCPVLVADIPALKETCSDAAIYCNPNDPDDIADKITMILQSDSLQQALKKKGVKRSEVFSWYESASIVNQVIIKDYTKDHV